MQNETNVNVEQDKFVAENIDGDQLSQDMIDAIMSGASFKDLLGISDEFMKQIYEHACFFYDAAKLKEAENFFKFLCIYDFHNSDYVTGYAAVCQLQENYHKAYALYSIAFALNPDNFYLLVYLGQCLIMTGEEDKARECFELILNNCKDAEILAATNAYLRLMNDTETDHPSISEAIHE